MGQLWQPEVRFQMMLEVEVAVAKAQASLGLIPKSAARNIEKRGRFDLDRIAEIEKTTRHDVIAFVTNVAENVGPDGRFVHFGLTSSDVLDTALSLQVLRAGRLLQKTLHRCIEALLSKSQEHASTICAGRTHGMHAEPTTFGFKLCGYLAEMLRNEDRLKRALSQMAIGKLSGAVGTYSAQSREVEQLVCDELGLVPETIATQVVPRDRHAELMFALASIGNAIERLSVELRHLQRTEVGEVTEGFAQGQKGSSAMPHKKNPISAENLTGVARLLRSHLQCSLENVALWHERDISHSSVERVVMPDSFIICDYALDRLSQLVVGLEVNEERMKANMNLSQGQLFSSHLLLALVEGGWTRERAYAKAQALSHQLKFSQQLKEVAASDEEVRECLSEKQLNEIFSGKRHLKNITAVMKRVFKLAEKTLQERKK